MKLSPFQKKKIDEKREKAWALYQEGLTLREVGKILNMSHEWVAKVVRPKLSTLTMDKS